MILYFDNLITDEPLIKGLYKTNAIRSSCEIYRMPDKLSIAMYELASYAELEWSHVIIKYELADKSKTELFESFVKKLFPNAVIIRGRSDSQAKFAETLGLIESMGDEWVFYSGNVDHPFISYEKETFSREMELAGKMLKSNKYVTAWCSHCFEMLSVLDRNSTLFSPNYPIVSQGADFLCCKMKNAVPFSQAVIHVGLLRHLLLDYSYPDKRVVRLDAAPVKISEMLAVFPKKEICEHFDGYSHSSNLDNNVDEVIPPLFIPPGFFESRIRIAAYYPDYREGWVNINPTKELYSFQDKTLGTDLKIMTEHLPLFWKGRISEIDINKDADLGAVRRAYEKDRERRRALWGKRHPLDSTIINARRAYSRLMFFKDNPESVNLESGSAKWSGVKKALHAAIMAGYKAGVFKRKKPA